MPAIGMFEKIEDGYMFVMTFLVITIENISNNQEICDLFVTINRARLKALKKLSFKDTEDELYQVAPDFKEFM